MKIVAAKDGMLTVEISEREYILTTAVFREIIGSMPKEDFSPRVGADISEIIDLRRALLTEGQRVGATEF